MPAPAADIATFRRFNRLYTRFIGTLDEGLLSTEFSLAEARILYELANRDAPKAKEIAADLSLDPGYLSRILTKFERGGLVRRKASEEDNRSAELALTTAGKAAFKKLNARSNAQAGGILDPLPPATRTRLIGAMQTLETILRNPGSGTPAYTLRAHRPGDMGWVIHRESVAYTEEYGWDQTFEALVARITADFITNFNPAREHCWIAEVNGENAGHIFLVQHPEQPDTAKLRLLFVEASARGLGLGTVLVNECLSFARTVGYRKVTLWTQSILLPAHKIYQKAGFRLVKEEPHHSFGHHLNGQTWELDLN